MATGAPFEVEVVRLRQGETSRDAIAQHSPAGKVPVLKYDGITVWDSLAICETLAERHPEAGLWPADAGLRARARAYACEMHSGFPAVRDQLNMDFVRRLPLPVLRPETQMQIARIIAAWDEALAAQNGDFLFGKFSIADCMYAPVVSRFTTYDVVVPPRVKAYIEKIWALPGMQNWLAASQKEVSEGIA
jgi:glutathione S-transferase